jgi:hypothetical protein
MHLTEEHFSPSSCRICVLINLLLLLHLHPTIRSATYSSDYCGVQGFRSIRIFPKPILCFQTRPQTIIITQTPHKQLLNWKVESLLLLRQEMHELVIPQGGWIKLSCDHLSSTGQKISAKMSDELNEGSWKERI